MCRRNAIALTHYIFPHVCHINLHTKSEMRAQANSCSCRVVVVSNILQAIDRRYTVVSCVFMCRPQLKCNSELQYLQ